MEKKEKMEEIIQNMLEKTSNGNWSISTEELRQAGITFEEFCEFLDNDERVCEYDKVDGEADIIFWLDYCPNLEEEEED